MESLERSNAVIDLGKRLVTQLKLGDDQTAQWMAHALAERIHGAENAHPAARAMAQSHCAELVFQLWERRYSLPHQIRPFKELEPLLHTLDSLDSSKSLRFRFMQEPPADMKVEEGVEEMLNLAVKLDDAARILVHHLLATAAEQPLEVTRTWIKSAADAGTDVTLEARIVSFIEGANDRSSDEATFARKTLKNKIQKLEIFASLAASHAADLRAKYDLLNEEVDGAELDGE